MSKKKAARDAVLIMRELARERVPVGSIRQKVVPMKKKALLDKIAKKEAKDV